MKFPHTNIYLNKTIYSPYKHKYRNLFLINTGKQLVFYETSNICLCILFDYSDYRLALDIPISEEVWNS